MSNKKKKLNGWLLLEVTLIFLLFVTIQYQKYWLTAVIALKLLFVSFRYYHLRKLLESYSLFRDFKHLPDLGTFDGQTPLLFESERKKIGVLLVHGFSSTPKEFGILTDFLRHEGIPFYTPVLTGFGLDDVHLLETIKETDWIRDAINAYDIFSSNCDETIVIGHSMGAALALHIASKRKVDKLILTAPYLMSKRKHEFGKKMLINSPFSWLLTIFNPYIEKSKRTPINQEHNPYPRFAYDVVPVNSIKAMWNLQERLNYNDISVKDTLLITGLKDNTVENDRLYMMLNEKKIKYDLLELQESGHCIFDSSDAIIGVKRIIEFIKK